MKIGMSKLAGVGISSIFYSANRVFTYQYWNSWWQNRFAWMKREIFWISCKLYCSFLLSSRWWPWTVWIILWWSVVYTVMWVKWVSSSDRKLEFINILFLTERRKTSSFCLQNKIPLRYLLYNCEFFVRSALTKQSRTILHVHSSALFMLEWFVILNIADSKIPSNSLSLQLDLRWIVYPGDKKPA